MAPFGKLYTYIPNARVLKILAAAKLNDLELEITPDYQHKITNRTLKFLERFPAGKVPAFEHSSGLYLAESDAIAQYVAQSGPRACQLLGQNAATAAQIRQWICFAEGELMVHVISLVLWRVGYAPYDEKAEVEGVAGVEYALDVVEKHIGRRTWLVGEELSLADLTLGSALYWAFLQIVDGPMRRRFPGVVAWYLRTIDAEGVKDVFGPASFIAVRRAYSN